MTTDGPKNYISSSGMEKLKKEYAELAHGERPKLVETVAWAASNGDRSENADYIYGKKRLREIDKRLELLNEKMEQAEVVDVEAVPLDKVVFGTVVEIEDEEGTQKTYSIVGEDEIDISKGWISWKSPVAKSLLGKKVNDEVTIKKPSGEETVEILAIKRLTL